MVYFFFQAEDGIRDYKVTGVQTCALPISHYVVAALSVDRGQRRACGASREAPVPSGARSEERRVGKECRARRSPRGYTKKVKEHDEVDERIVQVRGNQHKGSIAKQESVQG